MARLIKRYGNRKLYDTQQSRYVTLDDITVFVKAGEEIRVIDNDTGEDMTAVTFAQIILEEERRKTGLLPLPLLRRIIQHGEATLQDIAQRVDKGMEAIGSIGEKAGKRVQELVGRGVDELLTAPQKRLEALQKRIDERVKQSVERITSFPAVQNVQREVARIEKSIRRLEERLSRMRGESTRKRTGKEPPP
jgi:polyhydroxyalkanoate synthesis repressor PhaR